MNCSNCGAQDPTPLRQVEVTRLRRPAWLYHCSVCDFHGLADPADSVEAGGGSATASAPSWLPLAYEDAFYGDTGYVDRNLHAACLLRLTLAIGRVLGLGSPIGCDMGCGLGMLPRLLRDHGLDFWGSDEFAAMELIRPFCNPGPDLPIGCRTAFEVIEHVPDAAAFLRQQVGEVPLFVFSTLMRRDGEIPAQDWWYYAFGNGQHISFHSRRSFQLAMQRAGLDPASLVNLDGPRHPRALHAIAQDWRWRLAFRLAMPLANRGLAWLLLPWLERLQGLRSRIIPDHEEAMRLKAERSAGVDVAA